MLAFTALNGATPSQGELKVYRFVSGYVPQLIGSLREARLWGPTTIETVHGRQLLFRERSEDGQEVLSRYDILDGRLELVDRTCAADLLDAPIQAVLQQPNGEDLFIVASREGQIEAWTWTGVRKWHYSLLGGSVATLSAADLNQNGRAELLVRTPGQRLRVYSFGNESGPCEQANLEHIVGSSIHNPVVYDLEGNGKKCILTPGSDSKGLFAIRAFHHDGSLFWESSLDIGSTEINSCIINAGQFLAKDHAGVAVSVSDDRLIREGTYFLDGQTGKILWFKGLYRDGQVIFPYRPHSIATAHDFDGDGRQEIGMDLLCYMAYLRGSDGSFAYIHHTRNINPEGALYAGHLYNSFCPIYKTREDLKPYWTVPTGFGPFGLMKPDLREGIWREDLEYDGPRNVAMVDVDGDRTMEVGYVARNDATFVCRDLWTGKVEWKLELPHPPNSMTITADVDGDGKGEFLTGVFCIGTNNLGQGELRWQSPVSLHTAIIADFDGDGDGEIACAQPGKIVLLNAAESQ